MDLHPIETKIHQLILQGNLEEAQKTLAEYKGTNPADKTGICCMEAWLKRKEGDVDGALELLTMAIEQGHSQFCRCHMSRVPLFLKKGDLGSALSDCNVILGEEASHIKESFHNYYRFMKAYILALMKNQEFELVVKTLPHDYMVWVSGKNLKPEDLRKIYLG
jgi:hypothetical protein